MKKSELQKIIREEVENVLKEGTALKASQVLKLIKTSGDFNDVEDTMYVKGNNLIVIDSFYYGEQRAQESLISDWSPGGTYYEYFTSTYNMQPTVVDSFSEFKATGRHKKLSTDGIVGVELSFEKI